jgi:hypothetical protein
VGAIPWWVVISANRYHWRFARLVRFSSAPATKFTGAIGLVYGKRAINHALRVRGGIGSLLDSEGRLE